MEQRQLTVRCVCGWETSGTEADVVVATIEHGQRVHNMTATRDEVLAMAVPPSTTAVSPDDVGRQARRS